MKMFIFASLALFMLGSGSAMADPVKKLAEVSGVEDCTCKQVEAAADAAIDLGVPRKEAEQYVQQAGCVPVS